MARDPKRIAYDGEVEQCLGRSIGSGAECPACACGDVSFLGPEKLEEKFIGDEKEIEILCPMCGTKHKGTVEEEDAD